MVKALLFFVMVQNLPDNTQVELSRVQMPAVECLKLQDQFWKVEFPDVGTDKFPVFDAYCE